MEPIPKDFDGLRWRNPEDFDACMEIGRRHKFPDEEIHCFFANKIRNGKLMKMNLQSGNWEKIKSKRELERLLVSFCVARKITPQ